jgi:predicted O-methyltransferase YrrM
VSRHTWAAVDDDLADRLVGADTALDETVAATAAAGVPAIAVSPMQGKLLHLLARSIGARSVLEIGTLGGYSTIWLARALPPGGRVVTLEVNHQYAELARSNIERAGLQDVVVLRVGRAIDTLAQLAAEADHQFDFIFIDADKRSTPDYFTWALELSHPGSLIVADNVIRDGAVGDPDSEDSAAQGSQRLHEMLDAEQSKIDPRVSATTIQTVGVKGYDGFTLMLVNDT